MDWTTPTDITGLLERYWTSGRIAAARLRGESLFPLVLPLKKPPVKMLAERFDEVRVWIRELENASKARIGFGYEIQWASSNYRQLGHNRLPIRIIVPNESDALKLLGKTAQAECFQRLADISLTAFPRLQDWIARKPLTVVENADEWERILDVLEWFCSHRQSGLYLRQIEIPGVHTKFIEDRMGLLSELLDALHPQERINGRPLSARSFEERFGLLPKPPLIRFRFLDKRLYIQGLSDLATPAADFARLSPAAEMVFITENEVNGLTFPSMPASLVIFGLGYGLERLAQVTWLKDRALFYWGDIDTHGFAMLDRLRAHFPMIRSFLMDRETLMLHRRCWAQESEQYQGILNRLTVSERNLYDDLREDRLGDHVRLEQERISLGCVESTLHNLTSSARV
jgi:hypothetical protein